MESSALLIWQEVNEVLIEARQIQKPGLYLYFKKKAMMDQWMLTLLSLGWKVLKSTRAC